MRACARLYNTDAHKTLHGDVLKSRPTRNSALSSRGGGLHLRRGGVEKDGRIAVPLVRIISLKSSKKLWDTICLFEIESGLTSFTRVDKERNKEGRERREREKEKIETCEGARERERESKVPSVARESPSRSHVYGARNTRANSPCTDITAALVRGARGPRRGRPVACCTRIHTWTKAKGWRRAWARKKQFEQSSRHSLESWPRTRIADYVTVRRTTKGWAHSVFPSSSHARVSWCTTRTCIRTQRLPPPPPHTRHSHGTPRMERSSEERGRGFSLSGEKIHSRSFAGNHRVRSTCILYSGFLPALFSRRAHDRKARIILDTVLLPFLVFARRSVNYDRLSS